MRMRNGRAGGEVEEGGRIVGQAGRSVAVLHGVPGVFHRVMRQPLHDDEEDDRPVQRDLGKV